MNLLRILITLTVLNLVLLAANLTQLAAPAWAQSAAPVVRARALQIVDERDRVRASIEVLPATTSAAGDRSNETVLFRLITERGRPSVKIGASENSAGMSLTGPTGTKDSYLILQADAQASSLKLRAEDGSERILRP
jgi:hypothetical protein